MAQRPAQQFLKTGLPLIILTVGGWLGLSFFMQGRYDVQDSHKQHVDLRAPVERQRAKRFNLENELRRLRGDTVDAEYRNKPIPRSKEQ